MGSGEFVRTWLHQENGKFDNWETLHSEFSNQIGNKVYGIDEHWR